MLPGLSAVFLGFILSIEMNFMRESILIVEDTDVLRKYVRLALEANGYEVSEAPTAAAAMDHVAGRGEAFDVIVLDFSLPDRDGNELIQAITESYPDQRFLICSGIPEIQSTWPDFVEKGYRFLDKPFSISELVESITQVIQS